MILVNCVVDVRGGLGFPSGSHDCLCPNLQVIAESSQGCHFERDLAGWFFF